MSAERIEDLVAQFLEERETNAELSARGFAAAAASEHPDWTPAFREELVAAIEAALEIEALLPGESPLPQTIGPFRVVGELGRGGMGIVYEVERDPGGERFALKLHPLSPLLAARNTERLRREIEALTGLSHPNIVRVRESGVHEGAPYIVMDLVPGTRLDEAAAQLSRDEAVRIVDVLSRAVHEAHRHGVIHRDLKPQNVILRSDGAPVLVDFGLSLSEEAPSLTVTGELLGTPRYMAPEQVRDGQADARSDVYALGLILYELLARRPARSARSREGLLREASDGSLIRPREFDTSIPKPLERVLLQALAVRPEDRYDSALAFAEDLARWRNGERVHARARTIYSPRAAVQARQRKLAWLALALLAAASAGAWLLQSGSAARAERHEEARQHLHRAFEQHLDGDSLEARRELRAASSLDRRDPSIRAVAAHLGTERRIPSDGDPARPLFEALRAWEAKDYPRVATLLREPAADSSAATDVTSSPAGRDREADVDASIRACLAGLAAERLGDLARAERELIRAAEGLPRSTQLCLKLARVYRRQGIAPRAQAMFEKAVAIDSTSSQVWLARAEFDLWRRDLDAGLQSIERAKQFGDSTAPELLLVEASIRGGAGQGRRARQILHRFLAIDSTRVEGWYQLGFSHDMDHELVPAVAAYRRACAIKPDHVAAWSCLANLYSGASRGHCPGCDSAYAAHPEMFDLRVAEDCLMRTLRLDRGRQEWITSTAYNTALRLDRRERLLALLDSLSSADRSSAAGIRLAELRRRVRLSSGS